MRHGVFAIAYYVQINKSIYHRIDLSLSLLSAVELIFATE